MSQIRNIDFLKLATPFATLSAVLVVASWGLIASGSLKLGIDFAGGTEALVSMSQDTKVSDQNLKDMAKKIKLDDKEYDASNLSDQGKAALVSFQFTTNRLNELNNMHALLQRAKNSYIDSLKQEILSQKAGYLLDD